VVECNLAKVEVAGSNPVSRSSLRRSFREGEHKIIPTTHKNLGNAAAFILRRDRAEDAVCHVV
jgi:hypothetical protein